MPCFLSCFTEKQSEAPYLFPSNFVLLQQPNSSDLAKSVGNGVSIQQGYFYKSGDFTNILAYFTCSSTLADNLSLITLTTLSGRALKGGWSGMLFNNGGNQVNRPVLVGIDGTHRIVGGTLPAGSYYFWCQYKNVDG